MAKYTSGVTGMVCYWRITEALRILRKTIVVQGNDTLVAIDTNRFSVVVQHLDVNYLTCDMFSSYFVHRQLKGLVIQCTSLKNVTGHRRYSQLHLPLPYRSSVGFQPPLLVGDANTTYMDTCCTLHGTELIRSILIGSLRDFVFSFLVDKK